MNTWVAAPRMRTADPGFQAMVRVPPGMCTLTGLLARLVAMAATAAAQAPVPQARVSPAPRSHERMCRPSSRDRGDVDVDPLGEGGVVLDLGPAMVELDLVGVVDEEDHVRVADVDRKAVLELAPRQRQRGRVHRVGDRDVGPAEPGLDGRHLDLAAGRRALDDAGGSLDLLRPGQRDHAARRIAARFDLAAVVVPDAHRDVGLVRRLDQDQLVAADPAVAIGDGARQRPGHGHGLLASVDDDEIVAEAMHLVELQSHWSAGLKDEPDPSPPREAEQC